MTDNAAATQPATTSGSGRWTALAVLSLAQFLMVLDQSVMNVSVSQLVEDFDTTITTIQGVITLYSLVMAMLMLAGGKTGDVIGRRRAFTIGLVIYGLGSALTAAAPTVIVLAIGWSILEGVGAALVLPALTALIAGNYEGRQRAVAFAVIGGVAGAGIAVGPIVGGWATTNLSWRVVFVGEVVLVLVLLASVRLIREAPREGPPVRLDVVGVVLSGVGLGAIVLAVLQSTTWGWLVPKASPIEPFGFAVTWFVVAFGAASLWAFTRWQAHRLAVGADPLVHLSLLARPVLRAGILGLFAQNLILMGIFFGLPLYLQLVLGFDAFETGVRMLPVSIAMLATSALGSRLSQRVSVRTIVRAGLGMVAVATLGLLSTIEPTLAAVAFGASMAALGIGMGLMVSQLGRVVQSSVDASGRGEAGGLQFTGMQLGSSLGVALIGAIVLTGLTTAFLDNVGDDPRISAEVVDLVEDAIDDSGADFVAVEQVRSGVERAGLDDDSGEAVVEAYQAAQLRSLKSGLLATTALALLALLTTRSLPSGTVGTTSRPGDD